jgi:hypothetical protein
MEKAKYALIGGALLLAVAFSFDADEAVASEPVPKVSPYPEVDKRIADLDFPESILEKYGPHLSVEDMVKLEQELRTHKEWVDKVVDEYKWVMTTDSSGVEQYQKLLQAQAELEETLADLKAQSAGLAKIEKLRLQLLGAGAELPVINARIDGLLEHLKIDHLRDVKGNMTEVYTAAHQLSLVGTHGNVWVDGAARSFTEVFGVRFANADEVQIPRRASRAFYEFYQTMRDATGQDPIIVEGHTGDLDRPTSGKHESYEHKVGTAADIVPADFSMTDDKVYKILMESKDNPYYRIKYEPGSSGEVTAFIDTFSSQAVTDGHFETEAEARKWFTSHLGHYTFTSGRHFHVVALGGLGHDIDPNGPAKVIASR